MSDNYDVMTEKELRKLLGDNAQQLQLVNQAIEDLKQPVPSPEFSGNFSSVGDVLTAVMEPQSQNSDAINQARKLQRELQRRNYAISHAVQSKVEAAARAECAAFVRQNETQFKAAVNLFTEYRTLAGQRGLPNQLPDIDHQVKQLVDYAKTLK